MKTASAHQVPEQWSEILRWVAAGEEVQVTAQDRVVAKVVPATAPATPDFLGRAKAVWGEAPPGKSLSALVSEARGVDS
ncbi:MAG: type II toxin-antitoxin system Phd/YefM family antitoxin [Opitutaceae bacterium]